MGPTKRTLVLVALLALVSVMPTSFTSARAAAAPASDAIPPAAAAPAGEKVSRPGQYSGYSPVLYDGYKIFSQYVPMRDGVKLAVDVIRPTLNGQVVETPLPVIWTYTPYNRRLSGSGLTGENAPGAAMALLKYGYVIGAVDMRGSYASYGWAVTPKREMWQQEAYWDGYDITEWFAAQPWSDGKIGLWGCSAVGHSQWQVATTNPPHLVAFFPMCAPSEYYDINGVTATAPMNPPAYPAANWPSQDNAAVAVDEDATGAMLNAAREEHRWNLEPGIMPFRDSASPWMEALLGRPGVQIHEVVNTFNHFPELEAGQIPFYQTANWGEDLRVKTGVIYKLNTLTNPKKTLLSVANHCTYSTDYKVDPANSFNITQEELRWYDYWMKGVPNGIMDEPPIYYYTVNAASPWRFAYQWPLPQAKSVKYYLGEPSVDAFHSGVNKGTLTTVAPTAASAYDNYTVDYAVKAADRDQKGMTFTTETLAKDTNLSGNPIIHLWISTTATDNDFLAFLYDVDQTGKATQIPGTEDGTIRASLRKLNDAPWDTAGLPWHRAYAADSQPLTPGEPVELVFDLATLSYNFKAGHRIRLVFSNVAIPRAGAPQITPVLNPAPVVSYLREAGHASYIELPVNAPIDATITQITRRGTKADVVVAFPETMDARYLLDIRPDAIKAKGLVAESVKADGHSLIVTFSDGTLADRLRTGKTGTIEGKFGNQYYFGDEMGFVAQLARP